MDLIRTLYNAFRSLSEVIVLTLALLGLFTLWVSYERARPVPCSPFKPITNIVNLN